jgi:hypothetical protein
MDNFSKPVGIQVIDMTRDTGPTSDKIHYVNFISCQIQDDSAPYKQGGVRGPGGGDVR